MLHPRPSIQDRTTQVVMGCEAGNCYRFREGFLLSLRVCTIDYSYITCKSSAWEILSEKSRVYICGIWHYNVHWIKLSCSFIQSCSFNGLRAAHFMLTAHFECWIDLLVSCKFKVFFRGQVDAVFQMTSRSFSIYFSFMEIVVFCSIFLWNVFVRPKKLLIPNTHHSI